MKKRGGQASTANCFHFPPQQRQTPNTNNSQLATRHAGTRKYKKIKQNTHKTPQKLSLKNKYEQQKKSKATRTSHTPSSPQMLQVSIGCNK